MRGANESRTKRARHLRRTQTDAERRLWYKINSRQLDGCKFVRQEPIGPYIADFACRERKLIVELDGGQHARSEHDQVRDAYLSSLGYRVLRFWNNEVTTNMEGVLQTVFAALQTCLPATRHASPRVRGEGSRREQACAAGEGEGAWTREALPEPPPHPRSVSLRLPSLTALSPPAGRGK